MSKKESIPLNALQDVVSFEKYLREELNKAIENQIKAGRDRFWDSFMNGDGNGVKIKGLKGFL